MPELPSGTVTFLFTDLEGSTRLWEEHPDAMQAALARHDEILRDAVERDRGYVVKTTGDGVHAAFSTAADAVDAAVAAQLALEPNRGPTPGPLRVRMGLHTGPAELRDGDYYGTAVNASARLMSVAHGGQIVVSARDRRSSCATTATSSSSTSASTASATSADAERVFQIVAARRSPASSRRCGRSTRSPATCPLQLTSFVGRDAELAAVADAVDDGAARDPHRRRRGRQDPASPAGRRRGGAAVPRRRVVLRARSRDRRGLDGPGRGRHARREPAAGHDAGGQHRRVPAAQSRNCSSSTTASTSSTK